jgi:hypothetical protein
MSSLLRLSQAGSRRSRTRWPGNENHSKTVITYGELTIMRLCGGLSYAEDGRRTVIEGTRCLDLLHIILPLGKPEATWLHTVLATRKPFLRSAATRQPAGWSSESTPAPKRHMQSL